MLPESLVLLNPAACGGAATRRYDEVRDEVARSSRPTTLETDVNGHWIDAVRQALSSGVRLFLAAGGDGTVNAVANALLATRETSDAVDDVMLGAIGLGSSNDFHKPIQRQHGRVPLRVDPQRSVARDVGVARYRDPDGVEHTRHFIVSASLGLTAEANATFGSHAAVRWLKRRSVDAAIALAALHAIVRARGFSATLSFAGEPVPLHVARLNNLSLMKTPYLAGFFRFATPVSVDDGDFAIHLLHDCGPVAILRALAALWGGTLRHQRRTTGLIVDADHPVALELDGEVVHTRHVTFDLLPRTLRCCT